MNIHVEKVQADLIAHTHENMEDVIFAAIKERDTPMNDWSPKDCAGWFAK